MESYFEWRLAYEQFGLILIFAFCLGSLAFLAIDKIVKYFRK